MGFTEIRGILVALDILGETRTTHFANVIPRFPINPLLAQTPKITGVGIYQCFIKWISTVEYFT